MVADDRTNRVHRIKSSRNNIDIGRERQNLARQRQRTNKFIGRYLRLRESYRSSIYGHCDRSLIEYDVLGKP